ncbi:MFS general substrate transporter, partial [Diplocarpon rosae]
MASSDNETTHHGDESHSSKAKWHASDSDTATERIPARVHTPLLREVPFIVTICMAQILSAAPLYVVGESFGITNEGYLSWYLAAFSLTVGTFVLPAGRLGDMYGHKNVFLVGSIWYGVWSLICGFCVYSSSVFFSVARGFQGIGPALMVPNALAIAGRSFSGKKKNYVFALFGASAPAGAVLGAVFSAILTHYVWWPWAYWVMGMVLFAYTATSLGILPPDEHDPPTEKSELTFDFAGTITGVTGLILFNFAWNQAGVVGWTVPYTYTLMIVGMLFFGAFVYVEKYVAKYPLVPINALSEKAVYALSIIACGWASFGIWVYFLWQLILHLRQYNLLAASAQQAPAAVSGLFASLTVAYLFSKFNVAYIMVAAMTCFLTGQVLLATVPVSQTYWGQTFASLVVMAWGMNMSFPAGTIILSNGMPREHQGMAASLVVTVVNYSISISLGIAGIIVRQTKETGISTLETYRNAWYFAIGLDGLGVVIALCFLWITVIRRRSA